MDIAFKTSPAAGIDMDREKIRGSQPVGQLSPLRRLKVYIGIPGQIDISVVGSQSVTALGGDVQGQFFFLKPGSHSTGIRTAVTGIEYNYGQYANLLRYLCIAGSDLSGQYAVFFSGMNPALQ
jgi:hypothetical protein